MDVAIKPKDWIFADELRTRVKKNIMSECLQDKRQCIVHLEKKSKDSCKGTFPRGRLKKT